MTWLSQNLVAKRLPESRLSTARSAIDGDVLPRFVAPEFSAKLSTKRRVPETTVLRDVKIALQPFERIRCFLLEVSEWPQPELRVQFATIIRDS